MTYLEKYKAMAEFNEAKEGDAIDVQVAHMRKELKAGRVTIWFLEMYRDRLRKTLAHQVEFPKAPLPKVALVSARRYMAIHTILAIPHVKEAA